MAFQRIAVPKFALLAALSAAGACSLVNAADDPLPANSATTTTTGTTGGSGGSGAVGGSGGDGADAGGTGGSGGSGGSGGAAANCGNGVIEGNEACDDGATLPDDGCSDQCATEEGWTCDDAPSLCTPICGDGLVLGDEACDDGNTLPNDFCAEDCRSGLEILFSDDMESGTGAWSHEVVLAGPGGVDLWNLSTTQSHSASHAWHSGINGSGDGATRLISPPIDLSAVPAGKAITLSFWQRYHYDDCDDPAFQPDGHILEVSEANGAFVKVTPVGGYPSTLDGSCGCPLTGPAYAHDSGNVFVETTVDLSAHAGTSIRFGIQVGWDCGDCAVPDGLFVDDVQVIGEL